MSKHTPGPWNVVEGRTQGSVEIFADQKAIAECWRRNDAPTEIANARLIAAAPDLLEALREMVVKAYEWHPSHTEKARAVIAKAEGGAA